MFTRIKSAHSHRLDAIDASKTLRLKASLAITLMAVGLMLTSMPLAAQGFVDRPLDSPYPGTLDIKVDATDVERKIVRIQQSIPVKPGRVTLFYPRFLPGQHGPTGDVHRMAGLAVRLGGPRGAVLPWQRDTVDVHAFHLSVPEGTSTIDVQFHFLAPIKPDDLDGTILPSFSNLQWTSLVMYPAGYAAAAIPVRASLTLPPGWRQASALRVKSQRGDVFEFQATDLDTLIDSPVHAGRFAKRFELDPPGTARPVALTVFATSAEDLPSEGEQIQAHRRLVQQAERLFGSRHFGHYEFLLATSEDIEFGGLEHHQSSENSSPGYFESWDKSTGDRDLLAHEFVHSWNGKFRRPADLLTPHFNLPMQNSLLWLYEGQTQYWGWVLAVRAGLVTPDQMRDTFARNLAFHNAQRGRQWRNLQDTTTEGTNRGRTLRKDWGDWQRYEDYYTEGAMLWLDADSLIREKSGASKSLDDFAKLFFGVHDGRVAPLPYTFDDIVSTLNAVQPHDWRGFLRERLDALGGTAPMDGFKRAGWKLSYSDTMTGPQKHDWGNAKRDNFYYSLGMNLSTKGIINQVQWDGPAFQAGLRRDLEVLAVNQLSYSGKRLAEGVSANKDGQKPIQLLVKNGDVIRTLTIDYRGGLQYPRLERIEGSTEGLDAGIFAPR